ncbi:methylmalonyl Co-A mutase-associated GTPase MeaB [Ketobacter alkanivorans]|uniref:Methylmalonyl Co-A mutase-associated GTPase MeaB n=1 Tax=Ketobacter alkanivorans TaxID=1917421 RepID=A0A2K9LJK6_9GAMM|nr:methylmalonyl Co-A mutase-associated GTPase MeaB [Ketobacter alkanivorans]AUM10964.1 methylmalonyl Co-A mutase-associated GTPase MeaB [Ketobacter alkanivorans]MCP5016503.1 methylmalonyl Co-A mutase-associated GTPase MeaB [Ketobacter sp.]
MSIDISKLLQGNRRALAKAITLTESKLDQHRDQAQALLEQVLPHTGNSIRVGITGIPGVGKSTFIESFGLHLIKQGHKVAVLAVDPSSPITGGSILGDKTRMEVLSQQENAFIRPSPSGGALGGVAQKTREAMLLCEAAGYDVILVETVGVGQSEYEVAGMVDFFLVLMLPNAGDELQGIKKGILELADAIAVNKADGSNRQLAQQTQRHYQNALGILQHNNFWKPEVVLCSALEGGNIDTIWQMIEDYKTKSCEIGFFEGNRAAQNKQWMWRLVHELIDRRLKQDADSRQLCDQMQTKVTQGETTPYVAAHRIVESL